MTNYLVFQLYGSLAAWGEPAVGETRHTNRTPGRGSILGLLAAALGIRRHEEQRLQALQSHYRIAVRQLLEGAWLQDYHTIQMPVANRKLHYATRRDELRLVPRHELKTILSTRDYCCDSYFLVAIEKTADAPYELETLRQALLAPVLPLYLGRKSCPPGLLLRPHCRQGDLAQVLRESEEILCEQLKPRKGWLTRCFWEGEKQQPGLQLLQSVTRWDQPVSRKRWQFTYRLQHQGQLEQAEPAADNGGSHVSVQS